MIKIKIISILILFFVTNINLIAQVKDKEDPEIIRVGVIAGLSGDYAATFQNWVNGINLAYEIYQQEGRKPAVKLTVEDDAFSPSKGLKAYKKLIEVNQIDALINGSSATIGAISPLVVKKNFPVIQLGEETGSPADDNIFQISPGNIEAEFALGEYLSKLYPDNLALFYTTHSTMIRFADAFKKGYKQPLAEYEMPPQMTDLKSLVARALNKKPTCIAILAFPPQGALLVKELQSTDNKIKFAFDASFQTGYTEYKRLLGDLTFLDNEIVTTLSLATDPKFKELYTKHYNQEPGIAADLGFDSFNLLISKYSNSQNEWNFRIKSEGFNGASGNIVFNNSGVRKPEFKVGKIKELIN